MVKEITCPKCKYELYPLDKVCDRCGTKVVPSLSVANKPNVQQDKKANNKPAKKTDSASNKKSDNKSNNATNNDSAKKENLDTFKKVAAITGIVIGSILGIVIIIFAASMAAKALKNTDSDSATASDVPYSGSVTIPEDLLYEIGLDEEYLDKAVSTGLAKSATVNEDGSVTLEMNDLQHKAAIELIKKQITRTLKEYVDDEYYDGVVKITPNKDFTSYDIVTLYNDIDEYDDSLSYDLFTMSSSYATCIGTEINKIHINLIEKKTNKTYKSFDYSPEDDDDAGDFEDATPDENFEAADADEENYEDSSSYVDEEESEDDDEDFEDATPDDEDEDDEDYDDEDDEDDWEDATPDYDDDFEDDEDFEDSYSDDGGYFVPDL